MFDRHFGHHDPPGEIDSDLTVGTLERPTHPDAILLAQGRHRSSTLNDRLGSGEETDDLLTPGLGRDLIGL